MAQIPVRIRLRNPLRQVSPLELGFLAFLSFFYVIPVGGRPAWGEMSLHEIGDCKPLERKSASSHEAVNVGIAKPPPHEQAGMTCERVVANRNLINRTLGLVGFFGSQSPKSKDEHILVVYPLRNKERADSGAQGRCNLRRPGKPIGSSLVFYCSPKRHQISPFWHRDIGDCAFERDQRYIFHDTQWPRDAKHVLRGENSSVSRFFEMFSVTIGDFLGFFRRNLEFSQLVFGGVPQAIGRTPQSGGENRGGNDGDGANGVVVDPGSEPAPTSDHELNKQGINGLILIVGVGYALWLAFGRKRPNLGQEKSGKDSGGDDRNS